MSRVKRGREWVDEGGTRPTLVCANCEKPLEQGRMGRPKLYCDTACRKAAQRRRDGEILIRVIVPGDRGEVRTYDDESSGVPVQLYGSTGMLASVGVYGRRGGVRVSTIPPRDAVHDDAQYLPMEFAGSRTVGTHAPRLCGGAVPSSTMRRDPAAWTTCRQCSGGSTRRSSIAGLHFLGAPAAYSFGPLCRFVAGTAYAAKALRRHVLGQASMNRARADSAANEAREDEAAVTTQ